MKNITEDTIKLIEVVKINNKTKHLSTNIVVGIKEKSINRTPNNTVILSLLHNFILDTSISRIHELLPLGIY